jgi:uncharacterized protein (TIRG00374 family)
MQAPAEPTRPALAPQPFRRSRIVVPVLLGVAVVVWLFLSEFDPAVFSTFRFTLLSGAFIVLAFLLMLLRDASMMGRFRLLADKQISWKQSFAVNVLSEFTSAVTPTAVGGSSLVVFFLAKEGVEAGRSTTIMLVNLWLDELYFIVLSPLLFLLIPLSELFPPSAGIASLGYVFVALYAIHLLWAILLYVGIFVRPEWVRKTLLLLFQLPVLRRWRAHIETMTGNLIQASHDMRRRSTAFWLKAAGLTLVSWSARFLVVNAIFLAFVPVGNHLTVFARQVILWIFIAIMPTPGGSGMSEWAFKEYYGDIFTSGSIVLLVAVIWRLVTYYLYLLLGLLILPSWLNEAFTKRKRHKGRRAP